MRKTPRPILEQLVKLLLEKKVVMTYKVKWSGGKQLVSVGEWTPAVKDKNFYYAVITGSETIRFFSPREAAKLFIDYVGRDLAHKAIKKVYKNE